MAEAGFEWSFSVQSNGEPKGHYSALGLALATTIVGAVVFVPEPLSAPSVTPPSVPPALHNTPGDTLDPTWGQTKFAQYGHCKRATS